MQLCEPIRSMAFIHDRQLSFSYKVNDFDIWCLIGVQSRQDRFYQAGLLK